MNYYLNQRFESMGIWEDVVVFPFGLFLIQKVDGEILNKKGINEKIRIIYEALKINFFDFNYSYICNKVLTPAAK